MKFFANKLNQSFIKTKHSSYFMVAIVLLAFILRFYNLANNPPSLYWDEASLGYNAFAILKAGIDEHGVHYPLTNFLAYGDAKPPLYIYATALSMAVFGVTDFAIRFPSAIAGTLAVLVTYFLTKELFYKHKHANSLSQISSLLLAISPWHLQMSRAAFEANMALTLFLAAITLFFKARRQPKLFPLSAILFVTTLYTFNSYRIFLPPFLILLFILYHSFIIKQLKWTIASSFLAIALIAPLIPFVLSDQAKLRFNEVTIFKNHAPVIEANLRSDLNHNALWSKVIHNRRVLFSLEFIEHYTDHFKPDFLFFSGDVNPRLSTTDQGVLYVIELPLLLIGIYQLIKLKSSAKWLIAGWFFLAFIPAGMARETPHALRSLQVLPTFQILIALGIIWFINLPSTKIKIPKLGQLEVKSIRNYFLVACYLLLITFYLDTYHRHYPAHRSSSWQYGYKELVSYIKDNQYKYDKIFVTRNQGRPHTYLLLYLQYDPVAYVNNRDAGGDAYGFTYTNSFDKYYFIDPQISSKPAGEKWLVISGADAPPHESNHLHTIYNLNNEPVFVVSEY